MAKSSFSSRTQQLYLLEKITQDYLAQEKAFRHSCYEGHVDEHTYQRSLYLFKGIKIMIDSCSQGKKQEAEECLQDLRNQYPGTNLSEIERLYQASI